MYIYQKQCKIHTNSSWLQWGNMHYITTVSSKLLKPIMLNGQNSFQFLPLAQKQNKNYLTIVIQVLKQKINIIVKYIHPYFVQNQKLR